MKIYVDSLPEYPDVDCIFMDSINTGCIFRFCDCKNNCPLIEFPPKDGEEDDI